MNRHPTRDQLRSVQLERLNELIRRNVPGNPFYTPRIEAAGLTAGVDSLEHFSAAMPFTLKRELAADQAEHPPYGTNLTFPLSSYTRVHQTSSTTGKALRWLDTAESWNWMIGGWEDVFRGAEVTAEDRVLVAFSFGPFIGLWIAFEAAMRIGCLSIPGGSMTSEQRLRAILTHDVTVLCCTPTYALRLGEVAGEKGIDLGQSSVRAIVVGGEPGASVPATRAMIKTRWPRAELYDHYGLTEVGPVTFECTANSVHVIESRYLCEVVDPETDERLPDDSDAIGELVVTNLGRFGSPVLRYRTRDLVQPRWGRSCACGRSDLVVERGIIGRTDDMIVVRGVNLYPSAVDQIVRSCSGIAEYRAEIKTVRGMVEFELKIEVADDCDRSVIVGHLEGTFRETYGLRVPIHVVPAGTLPRFELKARRWIRA